MGNIQPKKSVNLNIFKTAHMKKLLLDIQEKSMSDQRSILDDTIEDWRGNIEQIDDILIIGRRF